MKAADDGGPGAASVADHLIFGWEVTFGGACQYQNKTGTGPGTRSSGCDEPTGHRKSDLERHLISGNITSGENRPVRGRVATPNVDNRKAPLLLPPSKAVKVGALSVSCAPVR